jgi:hypothetical protein
VTPAKPRLVSNASPAASIIAFAACHLERTRGGRVDDFHMAHVVACSDADERALMPDESSPDAAKRAPPLAQAADI